MEILLAAIAGLPLGALVAWLWTAPRRRHVAAERRRLEADLNEHELHWAEFRAGIRSEPPHWRGAVAIGWNAVADTCPHEWLSVPTRGVPGLEMCVRCQRRQVVGEGFRADI